MQIKTSAFNENAIKKLPKKIEQTAPENNKTQLNINTLSFMSIPSIAFSGRLVVPKLPENLSASPKPYIGFKDKEVKRFTETEPVINYKVFPQDPLISQPEMYKMKGMVEAGPSNERIMTVDNSEPVTMKDGAFNEDVSSAGFDRVNTFLFMNKTLKMYENALGREVPWSFGEDQIKAHPRAGEKMNAYYSRFDGEIKLFYFNHKFKPEEKCYTSKMADVITHETGHAILDGLKPSYIGWGSHGGAIHEGFGDSSAMLVAMMNDKLLDKVVEQTKGDLRKENYVASLAEQFGEAVYGNRKYLRNAINDLKLSDFNTGKESQEVHNFGRLFGAMFYDIICDMTAKNAESMELKPALVKTRDDLTKLFARAMGDFAPPGNVYYDDIAKALLQADKTDFGGKYKDVLSNVLTKREILSREEIEDWQAKQTKLPDIKIPTLTTFDTKATITEFVSKNKDALGLDPGINYQLESTYSNEFGEIFIQLKGSRKVPVKSEQFGDYYIYVNDGVTLGFDNDCKLFCKLVNQTRPFEIDDAVMDAKNELEKLSQNQEKGIKLPPNIYQESKRSKVLVKVPRLEDPVY